MSADPQTVAPRRYLSRLTRGTLAVIMAGGRGERLKHLTEHRCKPATPFGGKFRIIDFVLSNCVNSGIRQISVLTQYKAHSLIQHIQRGWGYLRGEFGEFVEVDPGAAADAARTGIAAPPIRCTRTCDIIRQHRPKHVLVLAGRSHLQDGLRPDDRLPRGEGRRHHRRRRRSAARAGARVRRHDRRPNGTASRAFSRSRTTRSRCPAGRTSRSPRWASTCSTRELLERLLREDADDADSDARLRHATSFPTPSTSCRCSPIRSRTCAPSAQNYWRDVGTVDAFYEANIELVTVSPELNIYDEDWPIWTYQEQFPPAKFVLRRRRPARHGDQLDGVRRLHHLRRARCASRCCSRACASTSDSLVERSVILPRRARRRALRDPKRDHRRRHGRARRHADRRRPRKPTPSASTSPRTAWCW